MPDLYSRAQIARDKGVSAAAVTKWCKGAGKPACVGKRVDRDHPAARKYLGLPDAEPTEVVKPGKKSPVAPPARRRPQPEEQAPQDVTLEDIQEYADMSLDELTKKFGHAVVFKDWLDSRKKISDIREKDLKNAETEGRLISLALVKTHVFGAIESSNRRLLGDSPKTIARRLFAMARSGATIEDGEKVVREVISSQLKTVKTTAARVLRAGSSQMVDLQGDT